MTSEPTPQGLPSGCDVALLFPDWLRSRVEACSVGSCKSCRLSSEQRLRLLNRWVPILQSFRNCKGSLWHRLAGLAARWLLSKISRAGPRTKAYHGADTAPGCAPPAAAQSTFSTLSIYIWSRISHVTAKLGVSSSLGSYASSLWSYICHAIITLKIQRHSSRKLVRSILCSLASSITNSPARLHHIPDYQGDQRG